MMDSLLAPDSLSMPGLVIRATILLSAALALAWLARKGSAGVRHLLWTMTFALLLGLPVLSLLGPSWDVPILPSFGSPAPQRPSPLMEAPAVDVARDAPSRLLPPTHRCRRPDPRRSRWRIRCCHRARSRLRFCSGASAAPPHWPRWEWAPCGARDLFAEHVRSAIPSGFDRRKRSAAGWGSGATSGSSSARRPPRR